MKRAVLVNGLPASGKSTVARALSAHFGWPILALDRIKEPFFDVTGIGGDGPDRALNRRLGQAAFAAVWNLVEDAPPGSSILIDAWFWVLSRAAQAEAIARAGVTDAPEVWCHAPGPVLAARYAARLGDRHPGHPGADYLPELSARAASVVPLGLGPVYACDTTRALDLDALAAFVTGDRP